MPISLNLDDVGTTLKLAIRDGRVDRLDTLTICLNMPTRYCVSRGHDPVVHYCGDECPAFEGMKCNPVADVMRAVEASCG